MQGLIDGPRLFVASRPFSQTGGHGDLRRVAEIGDLISYCSEVGYVTTVYDGADEVLKAAREQLRRGADQVEVVASGGAMSPNDAFESVESKSLWAWATLEPVMASLSRSMMPDSSWNSRRAPSRRRGSMNWHIRGPRAAMGASR